MKKIIFSASLLLFSSCGCLEFASSLRQKIKPTVFNGVVANKFEDSADRMTPKITLTSGDTCPIYAYEMFDIIIEGDSIVKEKGSLRYTLFRNQKKVGSYYPKCDNKEIK